MQQIFISVRIPALRQTKDFIVPPNMSVKDVKNLILNILKSEFGVSCIPDKCQLFDIADGLLLREECSLIQLGLSDGCKLIIM